MASADSTINHLEDFLLNDGPKQDCLVRICKYIDVFDMVNVSESSKHPVLFMELFQERVIDMDSFDFTKNSSERCTDVSSKPTEQSINGVFQHFGPHMQRIKVSTH